MARAYAPRTCLRAAIEAARAAGVTVIVDPGPACPLENYRGATMIKPNRIETELATGLKISAPKDALVAGQELCRRVDSQIALVTLDRDGMLLVDREGHGEMFPTQARAVYDITRRRRHGVVGRRPVSGCWSDSSASRPAGQRGRRFGDRADRRGRDLARRDSRGTDVRPARPGTQDRHARTNAALAQEHRRRGERIVSPNGCFDLLHVGHVTCLSECATMARCWSSA